MLRNLKICVSDTQMLIQAAVSLQSEIGFVAHYVVKIGSRCPGRILITIVKIKVGTISGDDLRKLIRKFGYRFPYRFAPHIPAAFFLQKLRHLGGNFLFADKSRHFGKFSAASANTERTPSTSETLITPPRRITVRIIRSARRVSKNSFIIPEKFHPASLLQTPPTKPCPDSANSGQTRCRSSQPSRKRR